MLTTEKLILDRRGIRFFADVQGCYEQFLALARDALEQNLALFSLGDLIDRGPDSPSCMRLACELHDRGLLDMVPGNHDEKFVRYIQGRPVKLRRGFDVTVSQLGSCADGKELATRYFDLVSESRVWRRFGDFYVVHGAFKAAMAGRDGPPVMSHLCSKELKHFALFGESNEEYEKGDDSAPKRTFNWVEDVPAGITVAVGHSVISKDEIVVRHSAHGGRVIHLDTGVDKGGKLSYLDISREMLLGETPLNLPAFRDISELAAAA